MEFDYSEKTWKVRGYEYTSLPSIGAWELALYNEAIQEAVRKSPLGKALPPENSPKYAKAMGDAISAYHNHYPKYAGLLGCEIILRPAPGSPPFAEAIKGLDMIQVATELAPVISFFFGSVKDSMPKVEPKPRTGKGSKGTRKASR